MKSFMLNTIWVLIFLFLFSGVVYSNELSIGNYELVAKKRVSRVEYEYTYKAKITNNGEEVRKVMAQLKSNSPNTIVVEDILEFENVSAGGVISSSDTFIIKQNRRYPFNWEDLTWDIYSGEAVGIIGPEGGTIRITDPESPIYDVKIHFPEDALPEPNIVSIQVEYEDSLPVDDFIFINNIIDVKCSIRNSFDTYVFGEFPVQNHPNSGGFYDVRYLNEETNQWYFLPSLFDDVQKNILFYHSLQQDRSNMESY